VYKAARGASWLVTVKGFDSLRFDKTTIVVSVRQKGGKAGKEISSLLVKCERKPGKESETETERRGNEGEKGRRN
jgi:hypothetical protein